MIPIEAREQPGARQTQVIVYSDVERQRMAQQGYQYAPTGVLTYGVPQEPATYVKYQIVQQPTWRETSAAGAALRGELQIGPPLYLRALGLERKAGIVEEWYKQQEWWLHPFGTKQASQQFAAAIIAVPESTVKVFKTFVLGQPEPTPPTFMGAMISPREREEFISLGPAYWAGSLVASGFEAIVVGKAAEVGYRGVKAITPEVVKHGLYSAKESVRFSKVAQIFQKATLEVKGILPSWKGSRPEMFLIKHVPAYQKYAAKQLTYAEFGAALPEKFGMQELKIEQLVFQLGQYPRGQMVYISKIPVFQEATTKSMQHLFYRAGQISIGYLKEPLSFVQREATFTPIVSQAQVTRMGIHPYMPKAISTVATTTGKLGTAAFATTLISLPKLYEPISKPTRKPIMEPVWQPTYAYAKERLRPQTLEISIPQAKEKEPIFTVPKFRAAAFYKPKLEHFAEVIPQAEQFPMIEQRVVQIATQKISYKHFYPPKLTIPSIPIPPMIPKFPGAVRGGGFDRLLRGGWFKKVHPIKSPEEMMATFGFGPRRRRKKGVK